MTIAPEGVRPANVVARVLVVSANELDDGRKSFAWYQYGISPSILSSACRFMRIRALVSGRFLAPIGEVMDG